MSVQNSRIKAFLLLADEELRAAKLLMQAAPRQAAYLCQQCAEKVARAVLTDAGVAFGTGHSLEQMAVALPEGASMDREDPGTRKTLTGGDSLSVSVVDRTAVRSSR